MSAAPKPPSGHFSLLYFASASTFTGKQYEVLPAPLPLRKLFATLEARYNGIKPNVLESSLVTINLNYVDIPEDSSESGADDPLIQEGDEVAIIPPVSSG
ncbi:molybdopterin synthase small subunit CnxG [Diaporthe helianthi]|uniref:Molybdopterin synthase sulfur carrier subunit n=1 Tax=Diaporthe helianthi TaxID=158607 RepID=A0A2P5HUH1_DIAHE|nr:molybdopterin synthase small subunit CnxG [Diaporthe helianthi]